MTRLQSTSGADRCCLSQEVGAGDHRDEMEQVEHRGSETWLCHLQLAPCSGEWTACSRARPPLHSPGMRYLQHQARLAEARLETDAPTNRAMTRH